MRSYSAPLLFAYVSSRVSHDAAHLVLLFFFSNEFIHAEHYIMLLKNPFFVKKRTMFQNKASKKKDVKLSMGIEVTADCFSSNYASR